MSVGGKNMILAPLSVGLSSAGAGPSLMEEELTSGKWIN